MKQHFLPKIALVFLSVFLILQSCQTDLDWDNIKKEIYVPSPFSFPIGKASISLLDLLENADFGDGDYTLSENADGIVALSISFPIENRINLNISEDISVPDIPIPFPLMVSAGTYNATNPVLATFANIAKVDGGSDLQNITELIVDELIIEMSASMLPPEILSNVNKLRIKTTFPTTLCVDTDIPFTEAVNLSQVNNNQVVELKISNVKFTLSAGDFAFAIDVQLELIDGNDVVISTFTGLIVQYAIKKLTWKTLYGALPPTLNEQVANETQPFDLGMLKGFTFRNPMLKLNAVSNVGALFALTVDNLSVHHADGSQTAALFDNGTSSKTIVTQNRPTVPGQTEVILDNYIFDRQTILNFSDLFANDSESYFKYSFSIGGVPGDVGAYITSSPQPYIEITDATVILPFDMIVNNFSYEDKIMVSGVDALPQHISPEKVYLQLTVANGFPVEIMLELTGFFDKNGNPIPAFYPINFIGGGSKKTIPAPTVQNGMVVGGITDTVLLIEFSGANYKGFADLNEIGYKISFDGSSAGGNNRAAIFSTSNFLSIHAAVSLEGSITLYDLNNTK